MTPNEYLKKILDEQTLKNDSDELKRLREKRDEVETLLRKGFSESSPTIRYGGSKAKGTLNKTAYDVDVICYFENDDKAAGESLADIYENVRQALAKDYILITKTSALRLQSRSYEDVHVDVVPGRFVDDKKEDAFLHRSTGDKQRLKTNLQVHIDHVRDSGVTDAIRLLKLLRCRNNLAIRHFALELLTIELLDGKHDDELSEQLKHAWTTMRDDLDSVQIEDPANPNGNDLSELLNSGVRAELQSAASVALDAVERDDWESIFGKLEEEKTSDDAKARGLRSAAASVQMPTRPWCR